MNKILLCLLFITSFTSGQELNQNGEISDLPVITQSISDFEDILLTHEEIILDNIVSTYNKQKQIDILIVTVEAIDPFEDIDSYSLNLAQSLTRGHILIVVSKKLRVIRIQNNFDIQSQLSDEKTKNIIDSEIIPLFREGKYFKGLMQGITEIKKELGK